MNSSIPLWLRRLAIAGVLIWMATITTLSSMTPPQLEEIAPFTMWDKAEHFLAFLAGSINLTLALRWNTAWSWKKVLLVSVLAISGFGAIDEIHQLFTPNRSGADPYDWTADTLGGLTGTLLTARIYARLTRSPRPAPARA